MDLNRFLDIKKTRKPMLIFAIIGITIGFFSMWYFNYSYSNAFMYDVQFESEVVIDGESQSFIIDGIVFEPKSSLFSQPTSGSRPLVVLIHGFAMSKEFMLSIGIELARRGVTSISISMPGHGSSSPPFYFANASPYCAIDAMDYMINDNPNLHFPINQSMLGIMGHSMGAMTAIKAAKIDNRFNFTVAIASPSGGSSVLVDNEFFYLDYQDDSMAEWVNETNPRNLLFVRGAIDELVYEEDAQEIMQAATGLSDVGPGILYNEDFSTGTSRKYALYSWMDHATEVYDPRSVEEMMNWAGLSWGLTSEQFNQDLNVWGAMIRPLLFIVAIVASFCLFWPTTSYLSEKIFDNVDKKFDEYLATEYENNDRNPRKNLLKTVAVYALLVGVLPTLIAPFISLPWPIAGNVLTDSPLPIIFLGGCLLLIFILVNQKFRFMETTSGKEITLIPETLNDEKPLQFISKYLLYVTIGIIPSMVLIMLFWTEGLFQLFIAPYAIGSFLLSVLLLLPITFANSILLKATIYPYLRSKFNNLVARILLPIIMGLICGLTLSIPLALTIGAPMMDGLLASFLVWIVMMSAILVIVELLYGSWCYIVDTTIYATSIVPAFFMVIIMFVFPMSAVV